MMLGSDNRIFHAGRFRHPGPLARVEKVGIKVVKIFLVLLIGQALVIFHPFVARRKSVEAKVNEHSKAGVGPPFEARSLLRVSFAREKRAGG